MRLTSDIHSSDIGTQLGDNEIRTGVLAAVSIGALSLAFLLILSFLRAFGVVPAELYRWSVIGLLFLAAFVMGGIIFVAWLSSRGHRSRVVEKWEHWVDSIIAANTPAPDSAPAPTPALPQENRMIRVNPASGGGVIPLELVDGWLDPRDVDEFAFRIANGGKWTEAVMESTPLTYSRNKDGKPFCWGKDRDGGPYRKLMEKCVAQGIIANRGGPGNKPGDLLIKDQKEIARRLKLPSPA